MWAVLHGRSMHRLNGSQWVIPRNVFPGTLTWLGFLPTWTAFIQCDKVMSRGWRDESFLTPHSLSATGKRTSLFCFLCVGMIPLCLNLTASLHSEIKGGFQSITDVCVELCGPQEANAQGPGGSCALDVESSFVNVLKCHSSSNGYECRKQPEACCSQ